MEGVQVVLGAGGGAGGAVIRALAAAGRPARAVTRSGRELPAGVEDVRADARDAAAVRRACEGASVVYHCVNVPYPEWERVLPGVMEAAIAGAEAAGARLVYCDNLYMYGPVDGPLREGLPREPAGAKGRLRARLEDALMAAHGAGRVEATIGRGSDFFGPGAANTVAGMLVFPAVVAGRKAHWLGSLDQPHALHYIDDFARALVTLGESPRAAGEVWHIPPTGSPTGREFIGGASALAERPTRAGAYRRWMIRLLSVFDRNMRELLEVLYQFERPFLVDGSKFIEAFGAPAPTPWDEAMRRSLNWHRGRA